MKRHLGVLTGLLLLSISVGNAQHREPTIEGWQAGMNASYADPEHSPLGEEDIAHFEGLPFFPIREDLRFTATFVRTPGQLPFQMVTTGTRRPVYEKYGEVHFTYRGAAYRLNVYQSHDLRDSEQYASYLFLPFMDDTNGFDSYGGGRYLELWMDDITDEGTVVVDFNRAYNPYCAYSDGYNCPIVPRENYLSFEVKAGVMAHEKDH